MQFRNLGKSGLKVSSIGLGTNQFGGKVDLNATKNISTEELSQIEDAFIINVSI